jgi:hypothetical protein
MNEWNFLGKMFLLIGLGFLVFGVIFLLFAQVFKLGRLPGDIVFQRENFTIFFPLATSIIISIVLTIIINLFIRR